MTRTVPKKGGVPQVRDTSKKQKIKEVKISVVGMEDKYGGRIIELVTDSERDYELLKQLVSCWFIRMISRYIGSVYV